MGKYKFQKPNKVPTEMLLEMAADAERQVGDTNLAALLRTLAAARDCEDCDHERILMTRMAQFSIEMIARIINEVTKG